MLKADTQGTLEAVEHAVQQTAHDQLKIKIVHRGVGAITERDVLYVSGSPGAIVIGFTIGADAAAHDAAERYGILIKHFDIIYKLTEWLADELALRAPHDTQEKHLGSARILKVFSRNKNKVLIGGRVEQGLITNGNPVALFRDEEHLGEGTITSLKRGKTSAQQINEGEEFGAQIASASEIAAGDRFACLVRLAK